MHWVRNVWSFLCVIKKQACAQTEDLLHACRLSTLKATRLDASIGGNIHQYPYDNTGGGGYHAESVFLNPVALPHASDGAQDLSRACPLSTSGATFCHDCMQQEVLFNALQCTAGTTQAQRYLVT
jgi:hypothetical protein